MKLTLRLTFTAVLIFAGLTSAMVGPGMTVAASASASAPVTAGGRATLWSRLNAHPGIPEDVTLAVSPDGSAVFVTGNDGGLHNPNGKIGRASCRERV